MSVGLALPFQLAFQPFVYGNLDSPNVKQQAAQLLTYLVLATTVASFGLLVGAYLLVPWVAPPAYSGAFLVALLLLPGQAFISLQYFGETLIGAMHKTGILGVMNSLCGAIAIGLSLVLIPSMGLFGAVLASNAAVILNRLVGRSHWPEAVPTHARRGMDARGLRWVDLLHHARRRVRVA